MLVVIILSEVRKVKFSTDKLGVSEECEVTGILIVNRDWKIFFKSCIQTEKIEDVLR